MLEPAEAWPIVQQAILAFRAKVPDMAHARHALAEVLRTGAWSSYDSPTGKRVAYEDFAEWVTKPVPVGLETTVENVWEIAKGDDELTREFERVGLRPQRVGTGRLPKGNPDNVQVSRGYGNTQAYIVRRLKRDRPDLAERVLNGEMKAHAAAVEAGFRKRTITVPVASPENIAATLRRHLDHEALLKLAALLFIDQGPGG